MYEKIAMKRHEVESSNIKSIGHSYPRRLLEIEFKDGNIYRYKGVNHKTYRALMNAESKGKEFHKNIKYSFPYKKYKDKEGNKINTKYEMLVKQAYEEIMGGFEKEAGFFGNIIKGKSYTKGLASRMKSLTDSATKPSPAKTNILQNTPSDFSYKPSGVSGASLMKNPPGMDRKLARRQLKNNTTWFDGPYSQKY